MAQRIWIMDRGMTSQENFDWLRETGRRYLVGAPKSEPRKWARQIAEARDWRTVREGVEAKQCVGPEVVETFVLVRSIERREKEDALQRLDGRIRQARRPLDPRRLERPV